MDQGIRDGGDDMIRLLSQRWQHGVWEFDYQVHTGVYHWDHYPVRLTHAADTPDTQIQADLAAVVTATIQARMASGSLSPHGQVMHWTRLIQQCHGSPTHHDDHIMDLCSRLVDRLPVSREAIISSQF